MKLKVNYKENNIKMPNETYYRHFLPSHPSFTKNGRFNCQQAKNITSVQRISTENIKIPLGLTTSNIIKSQVINEKKKNSSRIVRNRKRIELLSQPKFRIQVQGRKSSSTTTGANSKITDEGKVDKFNVNNPPSVPHSFRAVTPRLLHLAQPKVYDSPSYNLNQPSNGSVQKPVVTKISKRIQELALPKKIQLHTSKDPFKVNPKALNASCPSRVKELARPKQSSQPLSQLIQDYLNRAFVGPI